jgi:hypothetical protein
MKIFLDPLAVEALLYDHAATVHEEELSIALKGDFMLRVRSSRSSGDDPLGKPHLVYVLEKIE